MESDNPECGACCKGSAPFFMCRDKRCICHIEMDLLAQKKYRAGGHKDPTAHQAIGNVMKANRK